MKNIQYQVSSFKDATKKEFDIVGSVVLWRSLCCDLCSQCQWLSKKAEVSELQTVSFDEYCYGK